VNDSRQIVLAGKSYKITVPFTLQQIMDCNIGVAAPLVAGTPEEAARDSYERALKVIATAVKEEHPELTVDYLRQLRGATIREFNAAATVIYEESGLVVRKEGARGEATAEPASTGQ